MSNYFAEQIDALDASIWTGELLDSPLDRQALKEHCERWLRAIAAHESLAPKDCTGDQ